MTFNRTLLLSATTHSLLGYMLITHAPDQIAPAMTTPELAHFIQVRLQLAPTESEILPRNHLVEETASNQIEQSQITESRPASPEIKKVVKKTAAAPKAKIAKTPTTLKAIKQIQTVPKARSKAASNIPPAQTESSSSADSPTSSQI